MPAPRTRRHLLVVAAPTPEKYTPHGRKIEPRVFPSPRDHRKHATALKSALQRIEKAVERDRAFIEVAADAERGFYITFESPPDVPLKLESLENRTRGIELVATQETRRTPATKVVQFATVFVPEGKLSHFGKMFDEYETQKTQKGEHRHKDVVEHIARLTRATLRSLWTDHPDVFPAHGAPIWWEVWLRRHDGQELARMRTFAQDSGLTVGDHRIVFHDRQVVLLHGTAGQLEKSLDALNDVAELRKAKETASFFRNLSPREQADWASDLNRRSVLPGDGAPAVCVLDTGITAGHPLLRGLISALDATTVNPAWGAHDDGGGPDQEGHGTLMAGLAAYGDLVPLLARQGPVHLSHRLESVKILPPTGANRPDLYGAITAAAIARPEIQAPERRRVFSMAVTAADQRDRGQPTSWSAAMDALSIGHSIDPVNGGLTYITGDELTPRLFVISAGNIEQQHLALEYLDRSDVEPVHDPGQSWNALTVGAYTQKAVVSDPTLGGWSPLAKPDDLSPWSTTSVSFQDTWPIKPEVVFEGGNVVHDSRPEFLAGVPDVSLLSTYYKPADRLFEVADGTSAAAAQAARLGAMILADYPHLWPETVRALIVHSADWTRQMKSHLAKGNSSSRAARVALVRRYGYGVPDAARALRSANDALTLMVQSTVRPFDKGSLREMNLHELPWPRDILTSLGNAPVRLRVTLSYFIEPNPGRRGWKKRHRYASYGLRFEVKRRTESIDELRKRLNRMALAEEEEKPVAESDSSKWFLGEQNRNKGSLHSDTWTGYAIDLAERSAVVVFPVSGWWKDQPKHDRSAAGCRYSLVVSIETPEQDVDIWTPVAQEIGVPVESVPIEV